MNRFCLAIVLVCALSAGPGALRASADERTGIRLWNIGGQAGMTLASAAIQGKIHGWRDVIRCLGVGSVSGLGIYEAKALVGRNRPLAGWILANVSGSLSDNAASGRHALARLGYTVGPFRVHVSMPRLDRDSGSHVAIDLSAYQTLALAAAVADNGPPRFRSGLVAFSRQADPDEAHLGVTYGVFPVTFDTAKVTWLHEFTHAVQSLQFDLAEPPSPWHRMSFAKHAPARKRIVAFEHIKIGMFNLANDAYLAPRPYHWKWTEIEAFRLTQGTRPPG